MRVPHCLNRSITLSLVLSVVGVLQTAEAQWHPVMVTAHWSAPNGTVYFLDLPGPPRVGFVYGIDSVTTAQLLEEVMFKTTNGGTTWRAIPVGVGSWANDITFKDSLTGWFAENNQGVYKTTNQGESWTFLASSHSYGNGIYYDKLNGGLFLSTWSTFGSTHDLLVSWDEGSTWQPVLNAGFGYNGFAFNDDLRGIVAEGGQDGFRAPWLRTTNGGRSWVPLAIDSECWQPVAIAGTQTQFAITDMYANILRTDDLWDSWSVVSSFPSSFSDPRTTGTIRGDSAHLIVQMADGCYLSRDQARSWVPLCGQPWDTRELPLYDHRFWMRYPYVSIINRDATGMTLWMLNIDSMQYFQTGFAFADGSKKIEIPVGDSVTVNYSSAENPSVGIDSAHFVLRFDPSLDLSALKLPASWTIVDSSSSGGVLELTIRDADTVQLPNPIIQLTFRTVLAASSAKVYLDSAHLFGKRLNCDCAALSVAGPDSVEIDFTGCGDSTLLRYMSGQSPFEIVSVVPNPARDAIEVRVSGNPAGLRAEMYDMLGRLVNATTTPQPTPLGFAGGGVCSFDVSAMPEGVYYLRLSSGGFSASRRVEIIR
ncbi:MAG: T9SS type A sorting domain-containing protein [Bacteroidota bacterium]|nr:T9SS type A sorting domain-containing protein [Bacteroidota bacterium]MDP4233008.1 T9SS type A sorting domain-containing protein [Bacteroidota bacterium]MDP4241847.1 T9SS type A sorting domain-containing protein [Bacteroidota bacterium]MDP4288396.1 T9SS type A sorting domain-containing protein [Bacteroidota bacterium]